MIKKNTLPTSLSKQSSLMSHFVTDSPSLGWMDCLFNERRKHLKEQKTFTHNLRSGLIFGISSSVTLDQIHKQQERLWKFKESSIIFDKLMNHNPEIQNTLSIKENIKRLTLFLQQQNTLNQPITKK